MIITRDIIRDDTTVNGYDKNDLCEFINYWKSYLLERGAKPGDKIGLCFDNVEIHYYALIFASFELGMKVVSLHRPNSEKECLSSKSSAHLPLDFFVYLRQYLGEPLVSLAVRHFKDNAKHSITFDKMEWQTGKFRSSIETPILARPDDVAFCTTSSGTTGDPKLITYTHKFLYNLIHHNWKDLEYNKDDKMVHFSSLNHGGVLTLLLPSLMVCKEHYFKTFEHGHDTVLQFVRECTDSGVTKIFFANGGQVHCFVSSMLDNDIKMPDTSIYLLSFICPDWAPTIKNGHLKSIMSPFGCSEVCGPVFLPQMNTSNVDNFDPRCLGEILFGFFDTKIENCRINTYVEGRTFVFDDIVEQRPDGIYFVSKTRLKKINDIDINPIDVIDLVEEYTQRYTFELYIDEIYNELYIITSSKNLHDIKDIVEEKVESYYFGNVPTTIIFHPRLQDTRINHKADGEKLSLIVERYRLTILKDAV